VNRLAAQSTTGPSVIIVHERSFDDVDVANLRGAGASRWADVR
jgi:hypothetical protein